MLSAWLALGLTAAIEVSVQVESGTPCLEVRRLETLLTTQGLTVRDGAKVVIRARGESATSVRLEGTRGLERLTRKVPVKQGQCPAVERVVVSLIVSWAQPRTWAVPRAEPMRSDAPPPGCSPNEPGMNGDRTSCDTRDAGPTEPPAALNGPRTSNESDESASPTTATNEPSRAADRPNEPSRATEKPNEPSRAANRPNDPSRAAENPNEVSRVANKSNEPSRAADRPNELSRAADRPNEPSPTADQTNEPSRAPDRANEPSRAADRQNEPSRAADKPNESRSPTDALKASPPGPAAPSTIAAQVDAGTPSLDEPPHPEASPWSADLSVLGGGAIGPTPEVTPGGTVRIGVSYGRFGAVLDAALETERTKAIDAGTVYLTRQWLGLAGRIHFVPLERLLLDLTLGVRGFRLELGGRGYPDAGFAERFDFGGALTAGARLRLLGPLYLEGRAVTGLRTQNPALELQDPVTKDRRTLLVVAPWDLGLYLGLAGRL